MEAFMPCPAFGECVWPRKQNCEHRIAENFGDSLLTCITSNEHSLLCREIGGNALSNWSKASTIRGAEKSSALTDIHRPPLKIFRPRDRVWCERLPSDFHDLLRSGLGLVETTALAELDLGQLHVYPDLQSITQ